MGRSVLLNDLLRLVAQHIRIMNDPGNNKHLRQTSLANIVYEIMPAVRRFYGADTGLIGNSKRKPTMTGADKETVAKHTNLFVKIHGLRAAHNRQTTLTAHLIPFHTVLRKGLKVPIRMEDAYLINQSS